MPIILASDHAGFALKKLIREHLTRQGHEVIDLGAPSEQSVNWAEYGARLAGAVAADPSLTRGIAVCGSGIGMSIVANKFRGVRAALCRDEYDAEMSRRHNDSNVLCLGARTTPAEAALGIVERWLATPFDGGRHGERLHYLATAVEGPNFR